MSVPIRPVPSGLPAPLTGFLSDLRAALTHVQGAGSKAIIQAAVQQAGDALGAALTVKQVDTIVQAVQATILTDDFYKSLGTLIPNVDATVQDFRGLFKDAGGNLVAQWGVKVQAGGIVAGVGLANDPGNGSRFYVAADRMAIAPVSGVSDPAAADVPFQVLTVTDASGNAPGVYIKDAYIRNAAIGTAKIADAAITNAKIANLDAAKITTGTLDAARISAGSITAAQLSFTPVQAGGAAADINANTTTITGSKITTGTLNADRIVAGTITASKLVLSGTDLIADPGYYDPVWWTQGGWGVLSTWAAPVVPATGTDGDGPQRFLVFSSGSQFRFVTSGIPVNNGQTYRLKLRIKVDSGTTGHFVPFVLFPLQAWSSFGQPVNAGTWTDGAGQVWAIDTNLSAITAGTWVEYTTLVTRSKFTGTSGSYDYLQIGFSGNLTAGSIQAHVEVCNAADTTRIANNATRAVFTNGGSLAVTTASVNGPVSVTCTAPPLGRNAGGTNRVTVVVTGTLYSADASTAARAHDLNIIRTDDTFTATGCTISGTALTIGTVTAGTVRVGQIITGTGVAADTRIVSFVSGSTWVVSVSQTVASTTISAIGRVLLSGPPTLFSIGGGNRGTGGGSGPTFALQAVDGDLSLPNGGPVGDTASPVYTVRVTPGGAYASYTFAYGITAIDAYK